MKEKFGDNGDSDVASLDSSHNSVSKVPVVSSKIDTSVRLTLIFINVHFQAL